MSKAKVVAILAALIAVLTGVMYMLDEDPVTQPDVPGIVREVSGAVGVVRGPVEVPDAPEAAEVVPTDAVAPAVVEVQ